MATKKIVKKVRKKKFKNELDNIEDSLKRGADYANYDKAIDRILDTKLQERDLEAEELFELNNRRQDD
jgi:hypothetical protein